jgi:branched-chain amino acid transport system substrate-binding protein
VKRSAFLALAAASVLGGARLASAQQPPIRIGVINPTRSLVGQQATQGAQIAAQMINADGGILGGRRVELVVYDSNFQPAEGVAAVQRLLNQDRVRVITGEVSSSVALAVLQVVRGTNALFLAGVPKHPDITRSGYDRVFRMNSTTSMDNEDFEAMLRGPLGNPRLAVLAENSDYGRLVIQETRRMFGPQLGFSDTYEMTQSDFSALVTNARASSPELLCVAGSNMEQYGNILRVARELRVPGRRCALPGILNTRGVQIAAGAAEGAVGMDIYIPTLDNALNRRFVEAYRARHNETPEKVELLGFESIWIAARAMERAGVADDTRRIADAIRGQAWETPRGTVRFDQSGQASSGRQYRVIVRDGRLVEWTE